MKTPLAWRNLTYRPAKTALASSAVAFAVVLMFMQMGFRNALFDSTVQLIRQMNGDLIAISPARYSLPSEQRFPASALDSIRSQPGVRRVDPVLIERSAAILRTGGRPSRTIRVIGVPPREGVFREPRMDELVPLLAADGTGLADRRTKRIYGLLTTDPDQLAEQQIELSGRRLRLIDTVTIGTDFAHDGNLILGSDSFSDYFPYRGDGRPLSVVDLGLIHLQPGADPRQLARRLSQLRPRELQVMTRSDFIAREIRFWGNSTPIGIIFAIGTATGFLVGVIICYQILFTQIHDNLLEFATLKAMGYSNRFFVWIVARQAIYLALLGFLPGLAISYGLFELLEWAAGLPMLLSVERISLILALTTAMCLVSGLMALRRLIATDPAALF